MQEPTIAQKGPYPVEAESRQKLFLVRLRQEREPAVLRRQPQGSGIAGKV